MLDGSMDEGDGATTSLVLAALSGNAYILCDVRSNLLSLTNTQDIDNF